MIFFFLSCCFTSTEAKWPIRDGDRVGRGWESEGSTAETARERLWTAARTKEVLRRCPLAIAQWLVHCAIAVSTAVLDRVTKTMSVAPLLTNNLDNLKQKTSNLLSPAPPPYSWSLQSGQIWASSSTSHLLIFWSHLEPCDLLWILFKNTPPTSGYWKNDVRNKLNIYKKPKTLCNFTQLLIGQLICSTLIHIPPPP